MTTLAHAHHDDHYEGADRVVFGFWLFILSDCIMFATLFVCYQVLKEHTFSGISIHEVASLPYVLTTGLLLLTASFTYGLSSTFFNCSSKVGTLFWLLITIGFGLGFVYMTFNELHILLAHGQSWKESAFLSVFFTLIGIHALHVCVALLWGLVLFIQQAAKPLNQRMRTRLTCFGLFFHFLNIIWIFIFALVYLMGAI